MPRGGGRGGGRGAATAGIRAVANALGIARNEVGAFTKIVAEAPPLYPPVSRPTLPIDRNAQLQYMAELRQELLSRFHESPFYLDVKEKNCDIKRYTDKYQAIEKEKLQPDWSRLPDELRWDRRGKNSGLPKKRRKIEENGVPQVEDKLAKLEETEGTTGQEDEAQQPEGEKEASSDSEEENKDIDEQEPLSDDDYLEEDNDYIHSYFDNGENYGEAGSDDNLDDDNAF